MAYIGSGISRFNTADELTVTGDAVIDTTTLVVDSTNNRVGVLTASPATALDVTGTVTADGLTVDTNTLHVDSTNNRVGIGTSSPYRTLVVSGDQTTEGLLEIAASTPQLLFSVPSGGLDSRIHNDGSGNFIFGTGTNSATPTERLRITSAGSVGIGTTVPSGKLNLATGASTACELRLTSNNTGSGSGDRGRIVVYSSRNDGTAYEAGKIEIDRSSGTADEAHMLFATNGGSGNTERMRINSSGNVGIGTSSPDTNLQVNQTGTAGNNYDLGSIKIGDTAGIEVGFNNIGSGRASFTSLNNAGTTNNRISFGFGAITSGGEPTTNVMTLNQSENVGIGTSSPAFNSGSGLEIEKSDTATLRVERTSSTAAAGEFFAGNDKIVIGSTSNTHLQFRTNGTERMRLDASGSVLLGTTDDIIWNDASGEGIVLYQGKNFQIATNNDTCVLLNRQGSDGSIQVFTRGGTQVGRIDVTASATSYVTSSDRRLKSNIEDAASASDKIDAIQVRQFDWNVDNSHQDYGLIAQELQPIEPLAVSGSADNNEMMGVDYSKLVPMLIKEIQELRGRVAALEAN